MRSEAAFAIHRFFHDNGFVYVNTPLITVSDCEGAGEMFRVTALDMENPPRTADGKVDYKRISSARPQALPCPVSLRRMLCTSVFQNLYVWTHLSCERSNTQRHAAEFWMIEPEIAFSDLTDDMDLAEAMTKSVVAHVLEACPQELNFFNQFIDGTLLERLHTIVESDFARVSYTDAVKLLTESGRDFEYTPFWGCDLQTEHERYLCEQVFRKPVFVMDYPKEIKAFICASMTTAKPLPQRICWFPASGSSSAAASARSVSTC